MTFRRPTLDERVIGLPKRSHFGFADIGVSDEIGLAQFLKLVLECELCSGGKFLDRFDIDIERIEKYPAVGRIGTRLLGAIGKQRVEWVESDAGRAKLTCRFHEVSEIGEIAVAPVSIGPDRIELDGEQPEPGVRATLIGTT